MSFMDKAKEAVKDAAEKVEDAAKDVVEKIDEKTFARHLYVPELPDADRVWRTSGEQRLSNLMLWQAACSEMVLTNVLWPDVDRRDLWAAIETYASRDRRYGGAVPNES